ncbi:hypothetical protein GQ55_9G525400 [Panicum hallii var. hallii]|uniref:Uncharacterized protein n=1 Tax=Panicum hallii var. hallii TaxID=1504633 RepID=A0A2T7CEF4_9POAL|nr:hypothetical protein GQ55_9G525400 [Panicum hallii var. hallii]
MWMLAYLTPPEHYFNEARDVGGGLYGIITAAKAGDAKKVVSVFALIRAAAYRIIDLIETSFLIVEAALPASSSHPCSPCLIHLAAPTP